MFPNSLKQDDHSFLSLIKMQIIFAHTLRQQLGLVPCLYHFTEAWLLARLLLQGVF